MFTANVSSSLLSENVEKIFGEESCDDLQRILADEEEKEKLEGFLSKSTTSKLFEVKKDAFAKTIIENIGPQIWKINSKNDAREENLLHFFINQKFYASINSLMATKDPHINELAFEENKAGNTPLMSSLTQTGQTRTQTDTDKDRQMEEVKRQIWKVMKRPENFERIAPASRSLNQRKNSLLHLCAQTGESKGLLKILKTIDPSQIAEVVFHQNGEGKTILDMCKDECAIIHILKMLNLPEVEERLKYWDNHDRNLFNCWARKNHHGAIYHLQTSTSKETFRDMILKKGANGNNPMMVAALHNNKESLDMFLFHVGLHQSLYKEDIGGILHDEDKYGDTLLALVIQQSGRLDTAKNILLDMEKKHHRAETEHREADAPEQNKTTEEGKRELTKCLRKYLQPSIEAQKALNDVENSLPKTSCKKAAIWMKVFLKSLFIPVMILFLDIFFDGTLVYQYHNDDNDNDYETQYKVCRQHLGHSNLTLCEERSRDTMPFVCAPLALDKISRFNYSLAFIITPWILYYIEYGQSEHWQESSKVS